MREKSEVANQENAMKLGEKFNVASPETNVTISILKKFAS